MQVMMGVIPCKELFVLNKALTIARKGIEELVNITGGEDTYFNVTAGLFNGTKQLLMIYENTENIEPEKEQLSVLRKLFSEDGANYVGHIIFELWPQSLHIYQAYLLPQYQGQDIVRQLYEKMEKETRLMGAPYMSFATTRTDQAKHFGFVEVYSMYRKKM
jgi:ribosomal protein S18 acetylase RimI-like enzyme